MMQKRLVPEIAIGILKNPIVEFKLNGVYQINNIHIQGEARANINKGLIEVNLNEKTIFKDSIIIILPLEIESDSFELKDVTIGIDFHWEQKENQVFQGALKLIIVEGKIQAINILPIENYLNSVISSEMNANSSLNLLKAHAIISRSWLLAQIQKQKSLSKNQTTYQSIQQTDDEYIRWYDREDHSHFHVCADDHCQRYQGITRAHNPNVLKAIKETAGEVLTYKGQICDARFSKACGGVSELFENCWEPENHPYLTKVIDNINTSEGYNLELTKEHNAEKFINGKPDAFCNTSDENILKQVLNNYDHSAKDFFRWKVAYTQNELSALIKKKSGSDFGDIIDLIPVERGESGRLIKLKIVGSKKTLIIGKELEIRRWLSESHLYSSAFTIEKVWSNLGMPSKFILKGAGWGHGVGLCQIGAAVMGEKGYDYKQILMHYYKGAEIEKRY
ncbi:MAG: SpoIID/LytB domain-containing protein [Salinivirgaceae bacterium]|jgi:stage II sporulation protein D|nr:SpoIID/LytB domain-containing protein [Salinivirgaceae bacterium]